MSTVHVAVVSTRSAAPLARATVRRALGAAPAAQVHVLDVDGTYAPTALESVLSPLDVGVRPADLHLQAMVHEPAALACALYPACASLSQVATVDWVTIWLPALNEAYADRFDVTYCASLH